MKQNKIEWVNIRIHKETYEKLKKKAYIKRLTLSSMVDELLTSKK